MKAMILSAGFGTRLKPLTDSLPKALVPYKNIPMINFQIERLKKIGVTEIIVNAHHFAEKINDYFLKNNFGVNVIVIVEKEILGTGGGILNAEEYFKNELFFLVINVDVNTNIEIEKIIAEQKSNASFATLCVQKRNSKRYLEFDSGMNLIGREDSNSPKENLYAFNGIHIISNKIFKKGFDIKFKDIIEIYLEVIRDRKDFIKGYDAGDSFFKDLGKRENLFS